MQKLLLGRKIGMTQVYDPKGAAQAVTVIQAGPCVVTQLKTKADNGYTAVQLGYGAGGKQNKPVAGHAKAAKNPDLTEFREVRLDDEQDLETFSIGQTIDVTTFEPGQTVMVIGTSKGKGYAGVVKRHGFAGGPATHGSDFHRAPGAIGGRWPQRVTKGRRMAGHMGAERITVKGLTILRIDPETNLIAVQGAVPGPKRGLVEIRG